MTRAIVVGSGVAGLTVALHAARMGVIVTLVTKDVLEHTSTRYAQGGIAGVMFDDDSVDAHVRDTLQAAAGYDPAAGPSGRARPAEAARRRSEAERPAPGTRSDFSRVGLQALMWDHVGLVRDAEGLITAASVLAGWQAGRRAATSESELEDDNLLLVARATVDAALARTGSMGAHYRRDDPARALLIEHHPGAATTASAAAPASALLTGAAAC